jgi:hypothetical protein
MTEKKLKQLCLKHELYGTPELNEILYLHYQGFEKIENLDKYTAVKALFLQNNALTKIENLEPCSELKCLVLENNALSEISGLEFAKNLDTLNLEGNMIRKISGLENCVKLQNLVLAKNNISSVEDVQGLLECPSITALDLKKNHISDPAVLDVIYKMPNLRVLYMLDNPVLKDVPNYRKTTIANCANLKYLDERPVFEDERRCAEAWLLGGREAEREERKKIKLEKDQAAQRKRDQFRKMIEQGEDADSEEEELQDKVVEPLFEGVTAEDTEQKHDSATVDLTEKEEVVETFVHMDTMV